MKIIQILPELNVGGVETGTVDLAKYFVANGHQSIVISNGGSLVPILESGGSKHYKLPVHKKSLWSIIRLVKMLRRIINQEQADIVHARSRVPAWIAYFACRGTNASFVTTCHGYYQNHLFSQVMGWGKLVITPSQVIGRHMVEDYKVLAENIRVIPRSVDLDKFNIPKEKTSQKTRYTIAILGRITPLKGHIYFLQAMAKLARTFPNIKVWIIGDVPAKKESYKNELSMLVKRLGLSEVVEFLGNRRDVPEILSKVDVLVFSSIVPESFGRAIVEAQAAGVPVVASSVGGVVEIIDHEKTGLLVPSKDPEAIASSVIRLLKDPELREQIVIAAKKKLLEKFTLEHMASSTIKAYEEVVLMMNILVIKISSLGDVVLITASLKALREKFPKAKIYCLTSRECRRVLQNCPYLDGIIIYDVNQYDKGWMRLLKLSAKLRRYKFDKVIDFQNSRKSHLLGFLSNPQESYGFDRKWGFLLTNRVKNDEPGLPAVQHQFKILKKINIPYPIDASLSLWPSAKDEDHAQKLLDSEWLGDNVKIVGINLSASQKWKTKNWPLDHVAQLCDLLSLKNIRVIFTGMEKDEDCVRYVFSKTKARPASFVGKTDILQLAALIKKCRVFITPDSSPLHIAAAMDTPCIAFFGPTSSIRHCPPAKKLIVLEKKLTCTPCYSNRCKILTHACMKEITPKDVLFQIEKILGAQN